MEGGVNIARRDAWLDLSYSNRTMDNSSTGASHARLAGDAGVLASAGGGATRLSKKARKKEYAIVYRDPRGYDARAVMEMAVSCPLCPNPNIRKH